MAVVAAMLLPYGRVVLADETDVAVEPEEPTEIMTVEETVVPDYDVDNDELAEQYILQELSTGFDACYAKYSYGSGMTDEATASYLYLKDQIALIASGDMTNTKITLPSTYTYTFTAADLGLSNLDNDNEVRTKISQLYMTPTLVQTALLATYPYELYWYDKTVGMSSGYQYYYNSNNTTVTIENLYYYFPVEKDYQNCGNTYSVNPTYGQAARNAASTVDSIINTYASYSDYDKLVAYNDKICELTDYNDAAAENISTPYGDPWQLVWVFDGDPKTTVVCEGYSKAFQYLCDKSTFKDSNLYAISVYGQVFFPPSTSGGHMWNIVHIDGNNYLVDVTSDDSTNSDDFFLVGASGSVSSSYKLSDGSIYWYDTKVKNYFSNDALTLSSVDFTPTQEPTNTPTPDPTGTTTPTPVVTVTSTPTPDPTGTTTPTPVATATATPTPKVTVTATPTPKATVTATPTPKATVTTAPPKVTTPAPTIPPVSSKSITPKLKSGVAHVQDIGNVTSVVDPTTGILKIGTTGMGKRLEEITIDFENTTPYSGTIQYRVHVQDIGWMDWVDAGKPAGTEGMGKRIEAIEIRLTGELAQYYSVQYCVHIQDYGDMQGWVKDGALAGTTGESKRIEELKIKIVPKGTGSPMSVMYRVHVQDYGWEKSYVKNGQMSGTSGESKRLEGIEIFLSGTQYGGGIKYKTHVQNIGWESTWSKDGEMSGTQGMSYRLEGISIELYGEVALYYDVYYRVHAQDIGWLSWAKNGEYSGTAGRSARLEGIQIVLVPKGSVPPGATYQGITAVDSRAFVQGF